ncbi:MAG: acyloxyacyl hydrolase [Planctomycetes bacterium]|nr:acyloxyacyl hydrolase [Planctomycetota bacterium]
MPRLRSAIAPLALVAAASPAFAARVSLSLTQPTESPAPEQATAPAEPTTTTTTNPNLTPARFLDKGWWGWSIGAGVAFNSESTDTNLVANLHTFLADDFEFNFGLGGWYYAQDEDGEDDEDANDALGLNPRFGFRWHFARPKDNADRSWSVYAEAGIGMVFTDHEVPPGGTHYNFTPHAGVGATFALGESGARFDLGVRWAHVSNASTSGTDDNPSRDSPMVYAGFMFPF